MYRLRTKMDFDAAHFLANYEGKCARMHGHLWVIEAFVLGEKLDKTGFVVDFGDIKNELKTIIDKLDHRILNDTKEIGNPTSENLAKFIFEKLYSALKPLMEKGEFKLEKIRVHESPRSWCEYFGAEDL